MGKRARISQKSKQSALLLDFFEKAPPTNSAQQRASGRGAFRLAGAVKLSWKFLEVSCRFARSPVTFFVKLLEVFEFFPFFKQHGKQGRPQ